MPDNLTTQSTTPATVPSSSVIATDQVAADANAHYQKIKLVDGTADSTAVIGGSTANGLDVDVTRVQGTVTVGDGGSTLSVDDGGGSLTVDGTVGISGTVPVTGTFYQTTQPVSGTVAVTGAYQATQPVSLATAPTTPVTGTFWQATQPVSGTVGVTGVATETTLSSVDTKTPALGQALAAASVPVILPSATITTLTPPAAITGFALASNQLANGHAVTATPTAVTALKSLATSTTVATEVASLSAPTGGLKNYITSIIIANTGTTSSSVTFRDGSGGTTILSTIAPALGGSNIMLPIPIVQTANTGLYFICGTATSTIYVTVVGYTGV